MKREKFSQANPNYHYNKNKPKSVSSINKNNQNIDEKYLNNRDINKKKNKMESDKSPQYKPKSMMEKDNKKLNIININKGKSKSAEQNKDMQAQEENQDNLFINSINEIRLPDPLYDISYDILQNW